MLNTQYAANTHVVQATIFIQGLARVGFHPPILTTSAIEPCSTFLFNKRTRAQIAKVLSTDQVPAQIV